ncbi:MAG: transposase [Verrucomicrobia bacterium]|nr:transposase [Verrucomicrobiota bacterium]
MPQSLANLLTHLIFSTKNRESFLVDKDLRKRTHAYLAAVLNDLHCPALIVGGAKDHLHILCQLGRTNALSEVIEHIKVSSSKWLKTQGIEKFAWQRGYGAFSISQSHVAEVIAYIENQEQHHERITFQEEYRLFLKRYRVPFDERYVWD